MFQYAKTVLFEGSYHIDPPIKFGWEFTVSRWPMGLTLAYMPFLAIIAFFGGDSFKRIPYGPNNPATTLVANDRAYRYCAILNPLVTAGAAVLVFVVCLQMGLPKRKAAAASLVFGLASPATAYTRYDFSQPLAGFLVIASIVILLWLASRVQNSDRSQQKSSNLRNVWLEWGSLLLLGFLIGACILTRIEMVLILALPAGLMLYLLSIDQNTKKSSIKKWFSQQSISRLAIFSLPLLGTLVLILYFNIQRFGSWSNFGYGDAAQDRFVFDLNHIALAMVGHTISPGRGIFFFFPISLFSLVGIYAWIKSVMNGIFRRKITWSPIYNTTPKRWGGFLMVYMIICALLVYSSFSTWSAGLSWGPRFLVPFIPLLTIMAFLGLQPFQFKSNHKLSSQAGLNVELPGVSSKEERVWGNKVNRFLSGLFVGLAILGCVFTFQGLLFNPEAFYLNEFNLTLEDFTNGLYLFSPSYSPLIVGWRLLFYPEKYDIYWLQVEKTSWRLALAIGLFSLGFMARSWIDFFNSQKGEVSRKSNAALQQD